MWQYWVMFLMVPISAAVFRRVKPSQVWVPFGFVGFVISIIIGWRDRVGGDWYTYAYQFWLYGSMGFSEALAIGKDPGYSVLSSLVYFLGGDIYSLNLVCASALVIGAVVLARRQSYPWLALLAAVPYLFIVVGMGYTRQSVAIGCAMVGLVALEQSRIKTFVFWLFVAAAFHKSAVLLLPMAALAADRNRVWTACWVTVMFALGAWLYLYESSEALVKNYIQSDYADASQGAGIRVAMNAVPSVLAFLFRRKLFEVRRERRLWLWMALFSLICIPLLALSATAVDRLALYFIPLQLVIFARLPLVLKSAGQRLMISGAVVIYYAGVQFVWLNYAGHVEYWVPYRFMPV